MAEKTLAELLHGDSDKKEEVVADPTDTTGIVDLEKEETLDPVTPLVETEEAKKRGRPKKEVAVTETKAEETIEEVIEGGTTLEDTLVSKKEEDVTDSFWDDVDKLRGEKIEVDYEGVDPLTPEGAFKREKAIEERAFGLYEDNLAQRFPKEYQALVMRMNGEDPSALYKNQDDFTSVELKEDDESTQKAIIRHDLKSKGLGDKMIDAIVKATYEEGNLFTEAKAIHEKLKEDDKKKAEEYHRQVELQKAEEQKVISAFSSTISESIKKGQVGDFVIPEKDKSGFYDYLANNIRFEGGKFYTISALESGDKLNRQLQAEFFKYKNGNLRDLIVKQAITDNARKLKSKIKEDKMEIGVGKKVSTTQQSLSELVGFEKK